jgi:hypothetical protein
MIMNTLEQLIAARKLVAKNWTQGESARNVNGVATDAFGDDAVSFCALGALRAKAGIPFNYEAVEALAAATPGIPLLIKSPETTITRFNDEADTIQADVLALYDRAIQEAS